MSGLKALEVSAFLALGLASGLNMWNRRIDQMEREATLAEMKKQNELSAEMNEFAARLNKSIADFVNLKNEVAEP